MFNVTGDFLVTHIEEKERQDKTKYFLVRILAEEGKSVDLYTSEDFQLQEMKFYNFKLSISLGAKTYVNIISAKPQVK